MFSHKNIFWSMITCLAIVLSACTLPTPVTPTPMLGEPVRVLELYVSTSGNDSNDCLSEAAACLTVYSALAKSTPFSTIRIGPGEFRRNGSALYPRYDLAIIGAGVDQTILANDSGDAVIRLSTPVRIEIRDLTVAGVDRMTRTSAAIEVREGVQLTLENCRIHDLYSGLSLFPDASATVRNCRFENNYSGLSSGGDLTLTDSSLTGNLIGLSNGGTALVEDTTIDGNGSFSAESGASTAAISNSEGGVLTMNRGSVSSNVGWGVLIQAGNVTLTGVRVNDNAGSGIWQQSGTTTVNSGIVQNNQGYGISIGGRSGIDPGVINILQTALIGNRGAGLRIDGGEIHVQNTTISGNVATSSGGGGIWGYGGDLFLLDSTVAYNTGRGLQLAPGGDVGSAVVTTRRSVIALNSGDECQLDPRVTFSASVFASYVCNESWTPDTLKLRPLMPDAGTFVHPIDMDSLLVDSAGPVVTCPRVDQRGFARPAGTTCDIGAYEYGTTSAAIVIATPGMPDIIPLVTDTPTPSPTPDEILLVLDKNANCRHGPGTVYSVLTSVLQGQTVKLIGRNNQNTWWLSIIPGDYKCWISSGSGQPDGDPNQLPVLPDPPTPIPTVAPKSEDGPKDNDGDGSKSDVDCDDKNAKIYPGAPETAKDSIDSNCDGSDDT